MSIKSAIGDFRNGLRVIFGKPQPGQGDRKLAKMCAIVEGQIPVYGKNVVRMQLIKSIESDLKRYAKKGKDEVDRQIAIALDTPEYAALLRKVGLEEAHIHVMAMEALRNAK